MDGKKIKLEDIPWIEAVYFKLEEKHLPNYARSEGFFEELVRAGVHEKGEPDPLPREYKDVFNELANKFNGRTWEDWINANIIVERIFSFACEIAEKYWMAEVKEIEGKFPGFSEKFYQKIVSESFQAMK